MRKVLNIYSTLYLPAVGGIELYTRYLAEEAMRCGYEVNVITAAMDGRFTVAVESGIKIWRLSALAFMGRRLLVPHRLSEWRRLKACCYPEDAFVLNIAQTRFFPMTLLATVISRLSGWRTAIIDHGSGHLQYGSPLLTGLLACYEHALTVLLKLFKPRFFGVSHASVEWLRHFRITAHGVVANAVPEDPDLPAAPTCIRNDQRPFVFFGSRLIPEKGILELVEGFRQFREFGYDYRLVLAGSGPLADHLRGLTDDSIEFVGALSSANVRRLLSACTIFVNPSNYPEGLPTVLLEAGMQAKPVISTPRGGSAEVINHRETGLLIETGRADLIAEALAEFAANLEFAGLLGANLQRLVRNEYVWPRVGRRFFSSAEAISWNV